MGSGMMGLDFFFLTVIWVHKVPWLFLCNALRYEMWFWELSWGRTRSWTLSLVGPSSGYSMIP